MNGNRGSRPRARRAFAMMELPLVAAMLAVLAGTRLCFAGHCAVGSVVAIAGGLPLVLLMLPPFFGKGR